MRWVLDELQAAILRVKLEYLDVENARRIALAARYTTALADSGLTLPTCREGTRHVYHQYVVRSPQRDVLQTHLRSRGIGLDAARDILTSAFAGDVVNRITIEPFRRQVERMIHDRLNKNHRANEYV